MIGEILPEIFGAVDRLNKLYSVASCWMIIAIMYDARSIEHKMLG